MMSKRFNQHLVNRERHAYLILAHHQFDILSRLVTALDDIRNDIYIHVDKSVSLLPRITTQLARIHFLENRIHVSWGDVSVVQAELLLFQQAYNSGKYTYYHLLSGVDMPLHTQDHIHDFFKKNSGMEFIGYSHNEQRTHIERKVQRFHLFPKHFRGTNQPLHWCYRVLRFIYLRIQFLTGIKRNQTIDFRKGTQWVSITSQLVAHILSKKNDILTIYQNTFCADEIFVQTICWNSPFRNAIYDLHDEANGSQRLIQWIDNQIYDWELKDLPKLSSTNLLFARKFNSKSLDLIDKLSDFVNNPS